MSTSEPTVPQDRPASGPRFEVIIQSASGAALVHDLFPNLTTVGQLLDQACRRLGAEATQQTLVLQYQRRILDPRMTLELLAETFPGTESPVVIELVPKPRRGHDTGPYYSLRRVLEELEVEYEELAGLVADGRIRALRVEDTTRFNRDDIQTLKAAVTHRQDQPAQEPSDELTLTETLSVLRTDTRALMQLVSEGELRAIRAGDQILFRKGDVAQVRQRAEQRYLSLADVLQRLRISERELARLVSEGQVRAFRDGDEMWFRRSDVDELVDPRDPAAPRLFVVSEVQQMLAVSEDELARMVADGEIRAFRDGDTIRFPHGDIARVLDRHRKSLVNAQPPVTDAQVSSPIQRDPQPVVVPQPAVVVEVTAPAIELDSCPSAPVASSGQQVEARVIIDGYRRLAVGLLHVLPVRIEPLPARQRGAGMVVEIVPCFPGCLVAPTRARVALDTPATVSFSITPMAAGELSTAGVELHFEQRLVRMVAMPAHVVDFNSRAAWALVLAPLLLMSGVLLELFHPATAGTPLARGLLWVVKAVGGFELAGLLAGCVSLCAALLWRQYGRPLPAVPLATLLEISLSNDEPFKSLVPAIPAAPSRREPLPERFDIKQWPGCQAEGTSVAGFRLFRHVRTSMALIEIPSGSFWMGADAIDAEAQAHERPRRRVGLGSYLIGVVPVTVSQFRRFVAECPAWGEVAAGTTVCDVNYLKCWRRGDAQRTHPVTEVSYHAAIAFCSWAGLRLPSEAQWEKAARGTRGARYPWGEHPPTRELARFDDTHLAPVWDAGHYAGYYLAGASPYGVLEMAGNVHEWVIDRYDALYYVEAPLIDPTGPTAGKYHVVRGGSYMTPATALRCSARQYRDPLACEASLGFRVALTLSDTMLP
jgi:formylglycine-generating enzyme required for sulfatase activity